MASLSSAVGAPPAINHHQDVTTIQTLLNVHIGRLGLAPLKVTGECDHDTVFAIREFQKRVLKMAHPDGRVDPNGRTLAALSESPNAAPAAPKAPITITGEQLPAAAEKVLREILDAAGLTTARVTSVTRTAADQARIMYDNIAQHGVAYSYKLYGAGGDKVTKVYEDNKTKPRDAVIALMTAKINEIGPGSVSKHCSNSHYVFDVAPSSITKKDAFVSAVNAHKAVSKLLQPPSDPAYHIEIPKNSQFL